MLLTSKDEGDLLEQNLAHHLAWGVDFIGVADNQSVDGTQDRLGRFGTAVATEVFPDFADYQAVRMRLLGQLQDRSGGKIQWAGVSDTDEFFWLPGATIREILMDAPPEIVCVSFHQKLFRATAADPPAGEIYARQLYRTTSYQSPLHTSWVRGKSFYRTTWLRAITSEHRNRGVPHPWWGPADPVVHHYMIRDEDQFVIKLMRLSTWRPGPGLAGQPWWHQLRARLGLAPPRPKMPQFREEWWDAFARGGEEGLRTYYRTRYLISAAALPGHLEAGHLVRDTAFAEFMASRRTS